MAVRPGSRGLISRSLLTNRDLAGRSRQSNEGIDDKDEHLATDYARLTENLLRFYDFRGKVVLSVGAGGQQLLEPTAGTKKLIAIDRDIET